MKPRHLLFSISMAAACLWAKASNGGGPIGPRSAALGHASLCLADAWSSRNNQGNLGFLKRGEAAAFYENRFGLQALSQAGFALAIPYRKSGFGLSYTRFGYALYREWQASLSYGLRLSDNIGIGLALDYLGTQIGDAYGKASALTGEVGLSAKLNRQLWFAAHVYNPFRAKITDYNNERIPTIFKTGLQYIFSPQVFLSVEAEKTSLQQLRLKAGLEYKVVNAVYMRAGVSSHPLQAAFGLGVHYRGFRIDLSSHYHPVLGLSPQAGLVYAFGKSKETITTPAP